MSCNGGSPSRIAQFAAGLTAQRALSLALLGVFLASCATPPNAPPPAPTPPPPVAVVAPPPLPPEPAPAPFEPPPPRPIEMPIPSKEEAPVELPTYARSGKRLPADGGEPGRVVMAYCRGFEIERDAASYFKRLERQKQLPTATEIAARSKEAGQPLTALQIVERDWAIRRENAKSSPTRCKVLGGSVDKGVAVIVLEADLNGKRQRGTATVVPTKGKWRVQDHGDWSVVK
jgi:outer membrane biosynthesis protein TonB